MIKSYKALVAGIYNINNTSITLAVDDVVYISDEQTIKNLELTTDYQTIEVVGSDAGTTEVTKIIKELKPVYGVNDINGNKVVLSTNKLVDIIVDVATDDLPTGSTLVATAKDEDDNTLQVRNYTFGAISAAGSENVLLKFDGVGTVNIYNIEFAFEFATAGAGDEPEITVTLNGYDETNKSTGATFVEGASAAATNAIVTNVQLIDKNGVAITQREIVEIIVLTDVDTPEGASALITGTAGKIAGIMTANNSILALSEDDGTIDVSINKAAAGKLRFAVKTANGQLSFSDYLVWTA